LKVHRESTRGLLLGPRVRARPTGAQDGKGGWGDEGLEAHKGHNHRPVVLRRHGQSSLTLLDFRSDSDCCVCVLFGPVPSFELRLLMVLWSYSSCVRSVSPKLYSADTVAPLLFSFASD